MQLLRASLLVALSSLACAPSNVFSSPAGDAAPDGTDAAADALAPDVPVAPDAAADVPAAPDVADDARDGRARVFIHVRATAARFAHADGLSGQTPRMHRNGIRSFDLLRSADDTQPLHVFDHGTGFVEAGYNDGDDTVVGSAPTSSLRAGRYTVGRVVLTHVRYVVSATMHTTVATAPGEFDNVQVLSRDTTIDGATRQRGWFRYVFRTAGLQFPLEGTAGAPVPTAPTGSPIRTAIENDETALYFPVDLTVTPSAARDVHTVIEFNVFESFRWEDQPMPGYERGVFDATPTSYEPVRRFGANSFRVFTE